MDSHIQDEEIVQKQLRKQALLKEDKEIGEGDIDLLLDE